MFVPSRWGTRAIASRWPALEGIVFQITSSLAPASRQTSRYADSGGGGEGVIDGGVRRGSVSVGDDAGPPFPPQAAMVAENRSSARNRKTRRFRSQGRGIRLGRSGRSEPLLFDRRLAQLADTPIHPEGCQSGQRDCDWYRDEAEVGLNVLPVLPEHVPSPGQGDGPGIRSGETEQGEAPHVHSRDSRRQADERADHGQQSGSKNRDLAASPEPAVSHVDLARRDQHILVVFQQQGPAPPTPRQERDART